MTALRHANLHDNCVAIAAHLRANGAMWQKTAERQFDAQTKERKWHRTAVKLAALGGFLFGIVFALGCVWSFGVWVSRW